MEIQNVYIPRERNIGKLYQRADKDMFIAGLTLTLGFLLAIAI